MWVLDFLGDQDFWHIEGEYETKEEALREGRLIAEKSVDRFFRIGKRVECEPFIDAEDVLDRVSEQLYSEFGEVAEAYLEDVSDDEICDLQSEINKVFKKWLDKHSRKPDFFSVEEVEVIEIEKPLH